MDKLPHVVFKARCNKDCASCPYSKYTSEYLAQEFDKLDWDIDLSACERYSQIH